MLKADTFHAIWWNSINYSSLLTKESLETIDKF